jgi:uncharacterized protein YndB with AHSA1/START domain
LRRSRPLARRENQARREEELMMGTTEVKAEPGLPFVDVSREFDAPKDLLYRAFTDPDLLVQWLGPRKYEMVVDRYEVRDGGTWRYIHRDDSGNAYAFHGVFHAVGQDRIVQTFEFEGAPGHVSLDSVEFVDRGPRTFVKTHSVFQSVEARDATVDSGMTGGMDVGFGRLDDLLGRLVPVG